MSMRPGYKNTYVGRFYEDLAKALLGGRNTRDEKGDLFIEEIGATLEVKGSGDRSSYGFRVWLDQMERYEKRLLSGKSSFVWYVLCFYRNKDVRLPGGKRTTEFARYHTNRQVRAFLRQTTSDVFILDLSAVQHIALSTPISHKSIIGHLGRKTLDIKRKYLESILRGQATLPTGSTLSTWTAETRMNSTLISHKIHLLAPTETREIVITRLHSRSHLTEKEVLL